MCLLGSRDNRAVDAPSAVGDRYCVRMCKNVSQFSKSKCCVLVLFEVNAKIFYRVGGGINTFSASVMYFVCLSYVGRGCFVTTVLISLRDPIDTGLDSYKTSYVVQLSPKFINLIRLSYTFDISPLQIATITVREDSQTLRASSYDEIYRKTSCFIFQVCV